MQYDHEEYYLRQEEKREERNDRYRLTESMLEFAGVIAGAVACVVLVVLIASLVSWTVQDARSIFSVILKSFGG